MYDMESTVNSNVLWWSFHNAFKSQITIYTHETNITVYANYASIESKQIKAKTFTNVWAVCIMKALRSALF